MPHFFFFCANVLDFLHRESGWCWPAGVRTDKLLSAESSDCKAQQPNCITRPKKQKLNSRKPPHRPRRLKAIKLAWCLCNA